MTRWGCQDCRALYGAWLSRCPRCGSAKELVVALSVCTECTTKYAVGLPKCPHCGSTDHVEDGQPMPKITAHGGPSSVTARPGEPGYMPPAEEFPAGEPDASAAEPAADAAVTEPLDITEHTAAPTEPVAKGGEEPSPGTSSSASTETPPTPSEPNAPASPSPARKTASRSKKAPTDSSSADSTAGEKTAPTSSDTTS